MVKKNTISSVLCQDFGIEDFESGIATKGVESIENFDLSNKLGLLSALKDRSDTEVVTFGSEAYNLLGEAKQLEQFATNQIAKANDRFAIAAEIKKNYGVEGFNAFEFGCEGFGEAIKNAFTAVVAGIKKVIQSITNWIRQVMNWIGSQIAKGQQKVYDKYIEAGSPTKTTATIKAILPKYPVDTGDSFIKQTNTNTEMITKTILTLNKIASDYLTKLPNERSVDAAKNTAAAMETALKGQIKLGKKDTTIAKLGSATAAANELVFGTEKVTKIEINAAQYLNVVKPVICSKDKLKGLQDLVKDGKASIRVLNDSLKRADSIAKSLKVSVPSKKDDPNGNAAAKEANKQVKATRAAVKTLANANRVGTMQAGILYGTFANVLKLRSYACAAMRAILSDTKKSTKTPKEGSRKDRLEKARQRVGL